MQVSAESWGVSEGKIVMSAEVILCVEQYNWSFHHQGPLAVYLPQSCWLICNELCRWHSRQIWIPDFFKKYQLFHSSFAQLLYFRYWPSHLLHYWTVNSHVLNSKDIGRMSVLSIQLLVTDIFVFSIVSFFNVPNASFCSHVTL